MALWPARIEGKNLKPLLRISHVLPRPAVSASGRGSAEKAAAMIERWTAQGVDVIAVSPNDPNVLAPAMRAARQKGVRVITWDADGEADAREFMVNQATSREIGFALVDTMVRDLGGKEQAKGDVAIVTLPFEYYLDFGIHIKARSQATQTFIVQLAGSGSYVPSARSMAGGGYGSIPASNPVDAKGGWQLAHRIVDVLESWWRTRSAS